MIETGLDVNHKSSSRPGFFRSEILDPLCSLRPGGNCLLPALS